MTQAGSGGVPIGSQDEALASEDNIFDELKTTRSTSWQFELRQMERTNRLLAEDLQALMSRKKKRKKRKGMNMEKDCANCHTRVTPEWRRGPSGQRDLCNSCGLRWAKQVSFECRTGKIKGTNTVRMDESLHENPPANGHRRRRWSFSKVTVDRTARKPVSSRGRRRTATISRAATTIRESAVSRNWKRTIEIRHLKRNRVTRQRVVICTLSSKKDRSLRMTMCCLHNTIGR